MNFKMIYKYTIYVRKKHKAIQYVLLQYVCRCVCVHAHVCVCVCVCTSLIKSEREVQKAHT